MDKKDDQKIGMKELLETLKAEALNDYKRGTEEINVDKSRVY